LKINDFFLHDILPKLEKEGDLHLHLERSLPTLIEPLPWVDYEIGGYYLRSTLIMRFNECKLQERSMKYADLSRVYNVLNYLGKIPWRINKRILGVV
jgi:DNA-directed RNA polymerase